MQITYNHCSISLYIWRILLRRLDFAEQPSLQTDLVSHYRFMEVHNKYLHTRRIFLLFLLFWINVFPHILIMQWNWSNRMKLYCMWLLLALVQLVFLINLTKEIWGSAEKFMECNQMKFISNIDLLVIHALLLPVFLCLDGKKSRPQQIWHRYVNFSAYLLI